MKNNRKIYIPYILTCIVTTMMFYMIHSLSVSESVAAMHGGTTIQYCLSLGAVVVGSFAIIFLFYTDSFVIKRRKKEFGLYNVLGMEKRHLGIVLIFETLFIALTSIVIGLFLGIVLDKLMYLIIARVLNSDYDGGLFISWKSVLVTLALFVAIFLCTYVYSFARVKAAQPTELLKSENMGEREPKSRRVMAVMGVLSLSAGYVCAILTKDAVSALEMFFIAVILVILGTYFLFTAGSIALLKLLKKNKKYYYKINHFTSVSGMTYRMKQNSVGLASICILFTMLLVTISTTTSFMLGRDDMIAHQFPYDVIVQANASESANSAMTEDIRLLTEQSGLTAKQEILCTYLPLQAFRNDDELTVSADGNAKNPILLVVLTADSYNNITGENKAPSKGEILISENNMSYAFDKVELLGASYTVKERVGAFVKNGFLANGISNVTSGLYIIVSDEDELCGIYGKYRAVYGEDAPSLQFSYGADFDEGDSVQAAFSEPLHSALQAKNYNARSYVRAAQADSYMSLYGGLFFLGVYLGTLFLMATILIIYYKQITESYEDRKRFEIMQKVGMSYAEVKKSINSQILTVFFLPLIAAGIHVAFAFPMTNLIMGMVGLTSTKLFAFCSLGCFTVFSLIYAAVYLLTAKVYYRIVKSR